MNSLAEKKLKTIRKVVFHCFDFVAELNENVRKGGHYRGLKIKSMLPRSEEMKRTVIAIYFVPSVESAVKQKSYLHNESKLSEYIKF